MPVIERVGSAIRTLTTDIRRDDVVLECRHCGHTLHREDDPCPNCGDADVARFTID